MSATVVKALMAAGLVMALAACGEKPQELTSNKSDGPAYKGVGSSKFAAPGWKAGDKSGWEQQLKTRAQNGQNEYSKTN